MERTSLLKIHPNFLLTHELLNDEKLALLHLMEACPFNEDMSSLDVPGLALRMRMGYKKTQKLLDSLERYGFITKHLLYAQKDNKRLVRYSVKKKPPRAGGG